MILTIVFMFILIFVEVGMNWWIIKKKKKSPDHFVRVQIRVLVAVVFMASTSLWYPDIAWNWSKLFAEAFMIWACFWWTFDTFLSLFRGNGWYKLDGDDPEEDSGVDQWTKKRMKEQLLFLCKLLLAMLSIVIFIIV